VIFLPPGDYGRVLGLVETHAASDVPRVSPRRRTRPRCTVDTNPLWVSLGGTLGRAIRNVVRFEFGERVEQAWATAVSDIIGRASSSLPGATFGPPAPRGGFAERGGQAAEEASGIGGGEIDRWIDAALSEGGPPNDDQALASDENVGPFSVLVIDSGPVE
jgi:hypothetical protein